MKKTAIFGGTFNPVHLGHTEMLAEVVRRKDIEKILVMPAKDPPHKSGEIAPAYDRLEMCKRAFWGAENVEISDFEINLSGKSYTVNTLEKLKEKGIVHPTLIIGADSLVNFHLWYRYEDILKMASLMVYKRAGILDAKITESCNRLSKLGGDIELLSFIPKEISSTEIRDILKNGGSISGLVPKPVEEYIFANGLYAEEL